MQISAEFTDLSASGIKPGPPQTVPESHIVNYTGFPQNQSLQSASDRGNLHQEELESRAQAQLDATLMTFTDTPGSSRIRPVRRTTQSAIDAEPVIPTKPVTAKKIRRPYKRKRMNRQVNIVCTGCYRGNSPSNNLIVLCDGCDDSWHQQCHNPNISDEVIEIPDMDWFCTKCNPSQRPKVTKPPAKKPGRPKKTMLSHTSQSQYSEEERRSYLSSLPHDALVQLLLKISTDWPLIPIFPPKSMTSNSPAAPAFHTIANKSVLPSTASQTQAPAVQTTPQPLATLTSTFSRTPARISYAEFSESDLTSGDEFDLQSQVQSPVASAGSHHDDYDSEDYRAYPVAGRGFHVPMSTGDLDIMTEDKDYPTFSHSSGGQKHI